MSNLFKAAVAASLCSVCAGSASAGFITDFNLVVLQNLSVGHDVEGRTFVGGNLSGPSATFAKNLLPASSYLGVDTLIVAGNSNVGNINLQAGNFRIGGSRSGNVNFNGGGAQITDPTLLSSVPGAIAELSGTSAAFAALAPNSTLQTPSGQPGPAKFVCSPSGPGNYAIFDISGSMFSNNLVQQIELQRNGAAAIIVNVHGNVNFNQGNMVGDWQTAFARANTLWNFIDATTVNFDRNFNGAVLAPNATVSNSTAIDGSVFAKAMNQNGEVHLPNYTGPVPTPGAAGLLGMAGLVAARRRR